MMLCTKIEREELQGFVKLAQGQWIASIKEDGDRVRMTIKDKKATLTNRRGVVVTDKYPEFWGEINIPDCILDGEMCVMKNGISEFNDGITHRSHLKTPEKIIEAVGTYPVTYVTFDIMELKGEDLRSKPWIERDMLLRGLNVNVSHMNIELNETSDDIIKMWDDIIKKGGEGVILKHKYSSYQENKRSVAWKKVKNVLEADITVRKFETHPRGITVETDDGIRCVVNGAQATGVADAIKKQGAVEITIRHLGAVTKSGKYRQPSFLKVVEE